MTDSPYRINSREWWEQYFVESWDANEGGNQTRYFMELVLGGLPASEKQFLQDNQLNILDWGCAFGEGVELLTQSYPDSRVVGLDFASEAIEQARRRHSNCEFTLSADGAITGMHDVIVTSNCLEHFEYPLEIAAAQMRSCRMLYIALVPYNEHPLHEQHRSQFKEESFPKHLGAFFRIHSRVFDTDPLYWPGRQLLVVYASSAYLLTRFEFEQSIFPEETADGYYSSLPLMGPDPSTQALGEELAAEISELFPEGCRILNAGSGGGWLALTLARMGRFQLSLMDISSEALEYARRLFEREEVEARFIHGDVRSPGEPEFDLVINCGTLERLPPKDKVAFLRGMASRSRNYVLSLSANPSCYCYWISRIHEPAEKKVLRATDVPLTNLTFAYEQAGLQYLGHAFMGESRTADLIDDLAGISELLREKLVQIHRSALLTNSQRCYLIARLGSVSHEPGDPKRRWTRSESREEISVAEVSAALAYALALGVTAQQMEVHILERERNLSAELAAKSALIAELENQVETLSLVMSEKERELRCEIAERDKALLVAIEQAADKERQAGSLIDQLAHKNEEIRALSLKTIEVEGRARSLSIELIGKEKAIKSLEKELAATSAKLETITQSLGWRILSRYGRVKYRYLLPLYKALQLPPYNTGKKGGPKTQTTWEPGQGVQYSGGSTEGPAERSRLLPGRLQSNSHDIVCFPIIEWDFRFQRPQQLMLQFAAAGHRVFYLSHRFHSSGPAFTLEQKEENIYVASLRGLDRTVYTDPLDEEACQLLFASLDELRRELRLGATVSFVQLPFWWRLADSARSRFAWPVVYDCMDYHSGFATNKKAMLDHENGLLSSSDLVVASSIFLEEQARRQNSNVLLLRNACEYEHFANAEKADTNRRPVIGYYGAIADWFDSDLVADLAMRRPDWDFWLIGATFSGDTSRLGELPNVSLFGEKPYSEIPGWATQFDVAIIPFKRNPLTEATNPVKAYEILAAGKPLVSVGIPEMAEIAPLVRLASTAAEFEREIEEALAEHDPDLVLERIAFAGENTWEKRYQSLAPHVVNVFPRASIVVVTFNNIELNRLCLESIYASTEWPNFEVIVVDNASTDGTPEYLNRARESFPNLRVILNDKNLGFAAANNQGLREAAGDYLVLLNNDTVVTQGWLTALIRHLHVDPRIGMVGPVTNAISNEAKIEVGYTSLEDMPEWAAEYVEKHDGQTFPISMLAMFCVAMRRSVFEEAGYLDERFGVGMFEDDDYCRRLLNLEYELRCALDSFVHHWQRASFRLIGEEEYLRIYDENKRKYQGKWTGSASIHGTIKSIYHVQLEEILAKVANSKGAVVFPPSIGWDIHLFQRPHHLAREFARQGFVSIFDSSNSEDDVRGFKEIETNLFLFNGPEEVLHEVPDSLLWTFVYNVSVKDRYPNSVRTVYDVIDDLGVFPYNTAFLEKNHSRGLREADMVTCVAQTLHREASQIRSDAIYLPNGVEYDLFATEAAIPKDREIEALVSAGKPIAGYYGALARWFDYQLLDAVAQLRPDWNFLLIGQSLDGSLDEHSLCDRSNVVWIGPRDYRSLPGYLKVMDAATIPFVLNQITRSTSPLKLYEYLAAAKPVIATALPECESFPEVQIIGSAGEFSSALDRALVQGRDKDFCNSAQRFAAANSWTARVRTIVELLEARENLDKHAASRT